MVEPSVGNGFTRLIRGAPSFLAVMAALAGGFAWAIHLEDRVNLLEREIVRNSDAYRKEIEAEQRRLDTINANGTSGLQLVIERTRGNTESISHLNERVGALETMRTQIEILRVTQQRLEDQRNRIIQAIDNTYNTLQEALRGGVITRKPVPQGPP